MAKHLHERRGITFQDYAALLAVRTLLDRGDITTIPHKNNRFDAVVGGAHIFGMDHPGAVHGCGTVGCIGGYMGIVMGGMSIPARHQGESSPLYKLFYPDTKWMAADMSWQWITPKVAVQAIDNWLRTGRPGWNKLVPVKYQHD